MKHNNMLQRQKYKVREDEQKTELNPADPEKNTTSQTKQKGYVKKTSPFLLGFNTLVHMASAHQITQ